MSANTNYPTSNIGSTYFNVNECHSFFYTFGTDLLPLSSQACSEVHVWNQSGQILYLYTYSDGPVVDERRIAIPAAAAATPLRPYVIKGLTNADQLSAKLAASTGNIYWRTQFFSNNPSR